MNSQLVVANDFKTFIADLQLFAAENLPPTELADFIAFTQIYFTRYPLDELAGRYLADIFGGVFHLWRFIQQFGGESARVEFLNPKLEVDGWSCPHTVLVVLQKDMPFLVDSIRIELNRRNIAIHAIKSTVFHAERDAQSLIKLGEVMGNLATDKQEALVYLEINLLTLADELDDIKQNLQVSLAELSVVVRDYQLMLEAAVTAEKNLHFAQTKLVVANVDESQAFLAWMRDNNFTFLGYSEYDFVDKQGKKYLRENVTKRLGVFAYKGGDASYAEMEDLNSGMARFHLAPQVLTFSKSSVRSRIHRQSYSDYVVIKKFDHKGDVTGEMRFMGLYTSNVYTMNPGKIPLVRNKVGKVFERTGLSAHGHDGKYILQLLDTFPRDELFLSNSSELFEVITGVARINERYMVRLFVRQDPFGKFVNCLVYIPRDLFTTQIRLKIQDLIGKAINATECDFNTYFSESILARVYLVFKVNPNISLNYDLDKLQNRIREITRSWEDHLQISLIESHGEEKAMRLLGEYRDAFSVAYREHFESRTAVRDMASIAELNADDDIAMSFYQPVGADQKVVRFKVFRKSAAIELSDIIPILENLGLRVLAENPYAIHRQDGALIWLHDFQLNYNFPGILDVLHVKNLFQDAFSAIWYKYTDNDSFNKLVLCAELNWREVAILRAYAGYMRQTLFNFSESYIAAALVSHYQIAQQLVAYFKYKFDPSREFSVSECSLQHEQQRNQILQALDSVDNLNEDRILRRFLELIECSLRTNYFQTTSVGKPKEYLSIKLSPRLISEIPEPRPLYEIFVYSPRVEGVHLRGGKVARGGLRWSDRLQDYRTEVLGLVKAQQVKNAVIVPNGAKGGFVCKQPPVDAGREAIQEEAIACYQIFVRGLLDLTDNLLDGKIHIPPQLIRYDDDDPYLVVAADKGTATFSDIANSISAEYNHWLGDAFASGGSQGYDHKGMGITARGAWISVMRHFKEKDINIQEQNFTVVGIGDMAGDVFGNGMLLSRHICLTAAFNHMHIFIDPNPDPEKSFNERQRLFITPKTTWADYDAQLISEGGGIFNRSAKAIAISTAMKKCFDIVDDQLTPNELIHALLKAPVDLVWNGGIGTYVKASIESHADVGDKANDSLRVNGGDLRCKVFGEGGNLGMTQRGRIEYCLAGGACNTDFIDNAAGVDCSDHEVNIKILLNAIVASGDLTLKQRNQLLLNMTSNISRLVLKNNYRQTQAITIAESESLARTAEYRRFMAILESQKRLNRKLEFLPNDDQLAERQAHGYGLTRPELSILISYAKAVLKEDLAASDIAEDPYVASAIEGAFPDEVVKKYTVPLSQHRLKREIIATQIANDMVNNMGISFVQRLVESTGAGVGDIAKAYIAARDIYQMEEFVGALQALDYKISAKIQTELMITMMRRIRRATRWFLRNRRGNLNPAGEVEFFTPTVKMISEKLPDLLLGDQLDEFNAQYQRLYKGGVPSELVLSATSTSYLYSGLSIAEISRRTNKEVSEVARLYFLLSDYLSLPWFANQLTKVKVDSFWHAMARETYMDDLESQLRSLTMTLITSSENEAGIAVLIDQWGGRHAVLINRWKLMVNELKAASSADFAVFSVALRDLLDLAQATQHITA